MEEEEEEDEEDCEFRLLSDVGSQSEDVSHSLLNGILWISIRIYPKPTEIEALNVHIFINVFLHINSKKVKGVLLLFFVIVLLCRLLVASVVLFPSVTATTSRPRLKLLSCVFPGGRR